MIEHEKKKFTVLPYLHFTYVRANSNGNIVELFGLEYGWLVFHWRTYL